MNFTLREQLENVQKELEIALEENEALKSEKEEQVLKEVLEFSFNCIFNPSCNDFINCALIRTRI